MQLFSKTNAALEASLAAQWKRMGTITHNIANEDTPGYQAKRVSFEEALAAEIRRVDTSRTMSRGESLERLQSVQAKEYELGGLTGRADGNNVDLINEQAELARTQIQYQALRQRISGYYTSLQYVISGGR